MIVIIGDMRGIDLARLREACHRAGVRSFQLSSHQFGERLANARRYVDGLDA